MSGSRIDHTVPSCYITSQAALKFYAQMASKEPQRFIFLRARLELFAPRVHFDAASRSQTEGEPEGHLDRNLWNGVVKTHVELLRNGLQQHPPGHQIKRKRVYLDGNWKSFYIKALDPALVLDLLQPDANWKTFKDK